MCLLRRFLSNLSNIGSAAEKRPFDGLLCRGIFAPIFSWHQKERMMRYEKDIF